MQETIILDENEYTYLTNRFEVMGKRELHNLPAYIVITRREKLRLIVEAAIENELDGVQREYLRESLLEGLSSGEIAARHNKTRQSVYRTLRCAEKRLYDVLKYAYICGFSLLNPPADFSRIKDTLKKENCNENTFV